MRLPVQLWKRKAASHKSDFGHILVLAGSSGFTGAAILTSRCALRAGAGLVTLGVPASLIEVFEKQLVEVMTLPLAQTKEKTLSIKAASSLKKFLKSKADVLAIGPGLSLNKSSQQLARQLIASCPLPMVIDADAISALTGHLDLLRGTSDPSTALRAGEGRRARILTPHPGEMARLINKTVSYVQANRERIALDFAKEFGVTIILKGHHSVIADSRGKIYINSSGNPGMATAGSGDCLTGIAAAFLAQGLEAFAAAKYAVYIHGLAGDLAAREKGELGLIASDIVEKIPEAIKMSV